MLIIFVLFALSALCQAEEPKFAVVEYHPFKNNITENVNKYIEIIEQKKDLDLIVFPENTLHYGMDQKDIDEYSTLINIDSNPCLLKTSPDFIKKLSCAANNSNTFLVINTVEKEKYSSDSKNNSESIGYHYYNTDVVFDKEGKIIARYRKYNLLDEELLDIPVMENITFSIDNSSKFGIFSRFDILYQNPAEKLVKEDKVNYIIFPTMWVSELPFLTALQTQQMWSMAHNVTLLAAGADDLDKGYGGSGIFYGNSKDPNSIILQKNDTEGTNTVIDSTTTLNPAENFDTFTLKTDPIIRYMNATLLALDDSLSISKVISHNDISCIINVTLEKTNATKDSDTSSYTYYAVAYSGVRTFRATDANSKVDVCGIIACTRQNIASCGKRLSNPTWPFQFKSITIEAEIQGVTNRTQYPNSLLQSLQPILPSKQKWTRDLSDKTTKITFTLNEPQNEILTFAVYGRNFGSNSSKNQFNLLTSFFSLIAAIFFTKYFN